MKTAIILVSFLSTINANNTIYYYIVVNHLPFSSRLLTSLILNLAAVTEMQKSKAHVMSFVSMYILFVSSTCLL